MATLALKTDALIKSINAIVFSIRTKSKREIRREGDNKLKFDNSIILWVIRFDPGFVMQTKLFQNQWKTSNHHELNHKNPWNNKTQKEFVVFFFFFLFSSKINITKSFGFCFICGFEFLPM